MSAIVDGPRMSSGWSRPAALSLIASLLLSGVAAGDGFAGRPLVEALRELQSRGLAIFFTSNLVRPDMRVTEEPSAVEPRRILDQLLAPHGLGVEPGPGGRLVVVALGPRPTGIRGVVRVRRSAEPLAGVRVLVPAAGREAATAGDGSFELAGLAPGSYRLEVHLPGFVVERIAGVEVAPRRLTELVIELEPAPLALDEIIVTPSRMSLLRQEPVSGLDLDRDDILALPHLGDDVFRALTLLPGVTGEEASARFNVRGGRTDEVLVLLDRLELFEPYHLKDFSSSVSIIPPRALREVNLITGGFPVQYGDRMSGVLDMTTRLPDSLEAHVGFGIITAEAGGSGTFDRGRGRWLASVRRGSLDLALDFLGQAEKPRYWDAFAKLEHQLGPKQRLGLHALHSGDSLDVLNPEEDVTEIFRTGYGNSYAWLTHQAILGPALFADGVASFGRVTRDRTGIELEVEPEVEGAGFSIFDRRRLDVAGVKQDWSLAANPRHYVKWGFDVRRFVTDYDYANRRVLDDPLAPVRSEPRTGTTAFAARLRGEQYSAYLSDRFRPGGTLTVEMGLRFDRHTLTGDRNLSPRLNLVWAAGGRSALRLAWGLFYQSQRPYELQVEDGETELAPAERTEQRVVGFEHAFRGAGPGGSDLLLRIEGYERRIRRPRQRFEPLFEPISIFPEIENDRVRIRPQGGSAHGLEILLRGTLGRRVEWWTGYAYARIEDRIGGRDVPRRFDQPHALNLDVNVRAGDHWNVNLAWRYHSGWPTTAIARRLELDEDGEAEIVLELGPQNAERLPAYHRLDLRASREWRKRRGKLGFYLEIQNLYNRGNVAGFDVDSLLEDAGPEAVATPVEETWGGLLPSFGVTWEF